MPKIKKRSRLKKRVTVYFYYRNDYIPPIEDIEEAISEGYYRNYYSDYITICRYRILRVMDNIEPETLEKGRPEYHGKYVIDPRSGNLYGIRRIIRYLAEESKGMKLLAFLAFNEELKLRQLGFETGKDLLATKGWKYK